MSKLLAKSSASKETMREMQAGLNTQDLASRLHGGTSGHPCRSTPSAYQDSSSSGGSSAEWATRASFVFFSELSNSPSSESAGRQLPTTSCATLTRQSRRRRRHHFLPTDPDPSTHPPPLTLLSRVPTPSPRIDRRPLRERLPRRASALDVAYCYDAPACVD